MKDVTAAGGVGSAQQLRRWEGRTCVTSVSIGSLAVVEHCEFAKTLPSIGAYTFNRHNERNPRFAAGGYEGLAAVGPGQRVGRAAGFNLARIFHEGTAAVNFSG